MPIHRMLSLSLSLGILTAPGAGAARAQVPDRDAELLAGLSASRVVAISDGEFRASSYGTGVPAPAAAGHADLMTVFTLAGGKVTRAALPVSNSVTAAPEILALTPDGRTAFVAERLGERRPGDTRVAELPAGRRLFAVDLADTAEVGSHPEALAVSPDGARVAVVSNTAEASLVQIVGFAEDRFGAVAAFDLAELGVTGSAGGPRGVTATNVQWHPSGRFLAVNLTTQDRVAFFALSDQGGRPLLKPWGNIVAVGRDPFVGRFTPDGGYYLTSDWGRDFAAGTLEGRLPQAPSAISVIRLAKRDATGVAARHERIGGATTDRSAEGPAISPDGRLVATVNMRGTALPKGSPRFDRDGRHFLATVFEGHDGAPAAAGAGIELFRVTDGPMPALERLGRGALPHGAHHVDVAR